MWISILLNIVISLIIIIVGHQLLIYLKDNYSIKKTKDLVGYQIQKYKTILNDIQQADELKEKGRIELEKEIMKESVIYNSDSNYIDLKIDLEHFLQEIEEIKEI
jgi:hypothetical protein